MRAGIALDSGEYEGRSSSRKAIEAAWDGQGAGGEEEDDDEEDAEEEGEEFEHSDEGEEEEDDDDDDDDDAMELGGGYGMDGEDEQIDDSEDDDDDEGEEEDDEEEEDEEEEDEDGEEEDEEEVEEGGGGDELEAELAAFREEEAEANRLAAAKSQNAVKGAAVRRQHRVWERALQTRIVLQRTLNASAKLPSPSFAAALKEEDEDVAPAMATFAGAARGALGALLELQAALIDGNPAIAETAVEIDGSAAGRGAGGADSTGAGSSAKAGPGRYCPPPHTLHFEPSIIAFTWHPVTWRALPAWPYGKKRKISTASSAVAGMGLMGAPAPKVWSAVESVFARFSAYRDVSCDRWHRKAQVSVGKMSAGGAGGKSGAGAGAAAQMSAFNQSVSAQVSSVGPKTLNPNPKP